MVKKYAVGCIGKARLLYVFQELFENVKRQSDKTQNEHWAVTEEICFCSWVCHYPAGQSMCSFVLSLCITFTTWEVKKFMSFLQSALRFMKKECCVRAWNLQLMKCISFFHALSSFFFLMQENNQTKKIVSLKSVEVSHSSILVSEFLLTEWQKLCSFLDSASSNSCVYSYSTSEMSAHLSERWKVSKQ